MKARLIKKLIKHYGKNWKTPLSKDLGVDVATVRRVFNSDQEISKAWQLAINCIVNH